MMKARLHSCLLAAWACVAAGGPIVFELADPVDPLEEFRRSVLNVIGSDHLGPSPLVCAASLAAHSLPFAAGDAPRATCARPSTARPAPHWQLIRGEPIGAASPLVLSAESSGFGGGFGGMLGPSLFDSVDREVEHMFSSFGDPVRRACARARANALA